MVALFDGFHRLVFAVVFFLKLLLSTGALSTLQRVYKRNLVRMGSTDIFSMYFASLAWWCAICEFVCLFSDLQRRAHSDILTLCASVRAFQWCLAFVSGLPFQATH